ncbi:putative phosphoenolpyruvate synthase [Nymphon striatum]|nr:putative phosphoenolpyruvate synthase [Nymphon striatum]
MEGWSKIRNQVNLTHQTRICFRIRFIYFWIREKLFRGPTKTFTDIDVDSSCIKKTGIFPTDLQVEFESPQNVDSPNKMDETSFMGVNITSGEILNLSLAKRQHDQCEAVIHFAIKEEGQPKEFELPLLPRTLNRNRQEDGNCWTCKDLKIWCLSPLCRWRISFNGLLSWAPITRVIYHQDDISRAAKSRALALSESANSEEELKSILEQYDEWGTFYGTYKIDDGEETELVLFGSKVRRIDEEEYILDMMCDNGTFSYLWGQNEELKVNYCELSRNDLHILEFSEELCKSSKLVGGKGSSLAILTQINSDFQVPPGFCITTAANSEHLENNPLLKQAIHKISDICCLGSMFEQAELTEHLKNELHEKMELLFGKQYEEVKFAVRSSAIGEDGEEISAAGQMETILGCKGLDQICDGIKKCWASCFGFRAVEYRRQNGQPIDVEMSVVVQEMVAADKAGVLFTRDPVNGNPAVISIAANYGIGESVVSAMSEPDSIVVNRTYYDQLSIGEIKIGTKQLQVTMKDNGGVEEKTVSDKDSKLCCITEEQALKLAQLGVLVEQSYGNPRDIEWAILEGKIFLLQARPITNLHNETEYFLRNELNLGVLTDKEVATAGNFKEVFPGALSTFHNSCFNPMFNLLHSKLGKLFGIEREPEPTTMKGTILIQQHRLSDRTMLTYFSKNHLSSMIKRTNNLKMDADFSKPNREILTDLFSKHLPFIQVNFDHIIVTLVSMQTNSNILVNLLGSDEDFTDVHLGDFALLLSIDSGTKAVESADVPTALQKLAHEIENSGDYENFLKMSKEEGEQFLTNDQSPIKQSFEDFITKHGHRCVKEFDVHTKTWAMEPSKLVGPIQTLICARNMTRDNKITVDEALDRLQTKLTPKAKKTLRSQVLKAREYVGYREQAKSCLIKTVDHYRQQYWKFARKLVKEGIIPEDELLFYMTREEIMSLVKNRSAKIIQRAMKRRRLHPIIDKLNFPEISTGIPKPVNEDEIRENSSEILSLKGIPVSRGIIEGTARVIKHVEEAHKIQPGDILITNATDIAWSPYFPSLSGVITELGGLISHGAVVAREYGIPCVVGVTNATIIIKSGETLRLNGTNGSVEVLSRK